MTSRTNASPPAPGGRVSGRLARGEVGFDVEIRTADEARLELSAEGPVGLEVLYELTVDESADLNASVSTRPSEGLAGHLSANAMAALLSAGALEVPPRRIVRVAKSQPSVAATIAGLALPLNAGMQQVRPQDRDDPANGAPPRT